MTEMSHGGTMHGMDNPKSILSITDLALRVGRGAESDLLLDGFNLTVPRGRTVALVGESGSGKTLAALAVLGLLPGAVKMESGQIDFAGTHLGALGEKGMRSIRGNRIGMIFQEPSTSLNPLMAVGDQIGESLRLHRGLGRRMAREQVMALMELVGIPDPRRRYRAFPHQLSGGVRQRVVIATALACRPDLLLADEPTTALDATVQAQILDLLSRLIADLRMSVLLISHDLGVVAALADRVAVLKAGKVVEEGSVRQIFKDPRHPYTHALVEARPTDRTSSDTRRLLAFSVVASHKERRTRACPLAQYCDQAKPECQDHQPGMYTVEEGHQVRCFLWGSPDV